MYDDAAVKKFLTPDIFPLLRTLRDAMRTLSPFGKMEIHHLLENTAQAAGIKIGKIAQPLRVAVTGGTISPPIDETLELIGQKTVLARLDAVLDKAANI